MNYYHILEVGDDASQLDIKQAFRVKLKRLHPDSSAFHKGNYDQKEHSLHPNHNLVELITAYTVLSDPIKRGYYDASMGHHRYCATLNGNRNKKIFNYEQFLLRRFHVFAYKAKFFLYDLVFNDGSRAVKVYEEIEDSNRIPLLQKTLGWYDFFDCLFLLAEHYQYNTIQTNPVKSLQLYDEICRLEQMRSYFKSYMEEVGKRILEIFEDIDFMPEKYNNIIKMFSVMVEWQIPAVMRKSILQLLYSHGERCESINVVS